MTRLPPPEQWTIHRLNEMEVAELIEQYVDFVDEKGRSVHLQTPFVRHFMQRDDGVFDLVVAIATLPIVLADGNLLGMDSDYDRLRGIEFHVQPEIKALVPKRVDCTPDAVQRSMQFLTETWLCDVLTDHAGKCVIIAAALTIIERSLLPNRPAFFVTAGRRGCGKTTTLIMLLMAVTGHWPAAAAWSPNEEERRKALLSYFLAGVPYILWDNIGRGTHISCPHIERSCTTDYYVDRRLGVSETVATAAATIHFFTGNNIWPHGDLASRSLHVKLATERPDPENRDFEHNDPVGWTTNNRAEIMAALYTLLLGNPTLSEPRDAAMRTRYKMWWRLVGSAVESAAKLCGKELDFRALFQDVEAEDEEDTSLAEVLAIMMKLWPSTTIKPDGTIVDDESSQFTSKDVAEVCNRFDHEHQDALRSFFCSTLTTGQQASPKSIGKKLRNWCTDPVFGDGCTLRLKVVEGTQGDAKHRGLYQVIRKKNG
jgi:hypothetical protein